MRNHSRARRLALTALCAGTSLGAAGLAVDPLGNISVGGVVQGVADGLPVTSGAPQPKYGGGDGAGLQQGERCADASYRANNLTARFLNRGLQLKGDKRLIFDNENGRMFEHNRS